MIKFGTGGWRAIIGEEFIKENVLLLAQGLTDLMLEEKVDKEGFVIGYDRRFLSDKAARWIAEVLAANNIKVYFIEQYVPTPMVMFAVNQYKTYYGAAVTASHNPYDYNGVKIITYGGRDASESVTQKIEEKINSLRKEQIKHLDFEKGIEYGLIENIDPFNNYIDDIISKIELDPIKKKRLKILFDPMFGASTITLNTVFNILRCQVELINARHDPLFGGRIPSPSLLTLKTLMNLVPEKGYDLGLGTDGDGDRLGIIDEKGDFVHPNETLCLLYYYFLEYKQMEGAIVRNMTTTHLLDRIAKFYGQDCYEVPVGFKHISQKMEETNALMGGESSGGIAFRGHLKGKDATVIACYVIEMICNTDKMIGDLRTELHSKFGYLYYEEFNIPLTYEGKSTLTKILFQKKKLPSFDFEITQIRYLDGVKIYFENGGWAVFRFSGTEPLLRLSTEMPSKNEVSSVLTTMKDFIIELLN
ncbi:MAG TPA: phosphoglucomutase/phosphomannomutase family protein [Defluviitoga sp.]|nr:phosphoglucomutase/phosphomannomutase family protein [Defluviitoga sp.]HOP24061.1 phosphoglucomutase/phosphomannomutase family protein [Defluviitoga sp.]HPZ29237.1 phosphoglucomutase/phosphomannomutase family protein [Defluviitoga sp.]HQD63159.1 phosphoglucomutase/phosphomannomutase family protein [Defluviitoga sp.]